jgi:hypothetical protein
MHGKRPFRHNAIAICRVLFVGLATLILVSKGFDRR